MTRRPAGGAALRGGERRRGHRRGHRNPAAPGGVEVTEPRITRSASPRSPRRSSCGGPRSTPGCPRSSTTRRVLAASGPAGALGAGRGVAARLPGRAGRTRLHRDPDAEARVVGSTESGATVFDVDYFGRTGLPGAVPAVLQADDGRRLRAGLRDRAGVPRRAARHRRGTWPSTSRWTSSSASSSDHRDVLARAARRRWPAWWPSRCEAGEPAVESAARSSLPEVPAEIPVIHFPEALALIAGATAGRARPRARSTSGALGRWARETHGCDFLAVEGYPMGKRPFYTHPQPGRPALDQLVRPAVPRPGAGHRRSAPAPATPTTWRRWRARGEDLGRYADYLEAFRARHAAARRVRDRARALDRPAGRRPRTSGRSRCSPATCTA